MIAEMIRRGHYFNLLPATDASPSHRPSALPFSATSRTCPFSVRLGSLRLEARDPVKLLVSLRGKDHDIVAIFPANEHRLVLDCIEERAEALSGSSNGNSFHISI
jgi:hypothetical protein